MPYVDPKFRPYFDDHIDRLIEKLVRNSIENHDPGDPKANVGDANYCITRIINAVCPQPYSYSDINAAIGVLECAKLELYRRIAVPYENAKKTENGDVPEYLLDTSK